MIVEFLTVLVMLVALCVAGFVAGIALYCLISGESWRRVMGYRDDDLPPGGVL